MIQKIEREAKQLGKEPSSAPEVLSYWQSGCIRIASVYSKNKRSHGVKMINLSFCNVNNKKQTLVTELLARTWIPSCLNEMRQEVYGFFLTVNTSKVLRKSRSKEGDCNALDCSNVEKASRLFMFKCVSCCRLYLPS